MEPAQRDLPSHTFFQPHQDCLLPGKVCRNRPSLLQADWGAVSWRPCNQRETEDVFDCFVMFYHMSSSLHFSQTSELISAKFLLQVPTGNFIVILEQRHRRLLEDVRGDKTVALLLVLLAYSSLLRVTSFVHNNP